MSSSSSLPAAAAAAAATASVSKTENKTALLKGSIHEKPFFQSDVFLVVGASIDRDKYGNKVLRSYMNNKYNVIPVNKKQSVIESISCVDSITAFVESNEYKQIPKDKIGVSIITPPGVTKLILLEGYDKGIRNFFLQPGTFDDDTIEFVRQSLPDAKIIAGCVLISLKDGRV